MALHLVRHAKAGSRHEWTQPDELRPLSRTGARQAAALFDAMSHLPVKRILSSRFVRCEQTVRPLAVHLGLDIEIHPALSEEARLDETWALLEELAGTEAALCTHGNIIPPVIERLERRGGVLRGDELGNKKGSVWVIETAPDGTFPSATYVPPPA
jgi:8-oxo-(d)GTP phosphatase